MRQLMTAAVAVLTVVAATGIIAGTSTRWRPHIAVVMPLALGAACLVVGTTVLAMGDGSDAGLRMAFGLDGEPDAAGFLGGTVTAVAAAVLLFRVEASLTAAWARWRRRRRLSLNAPSFLGVDLPGRSESMQDVAAIARRPVLFSALSGWSAALEEFFYRGVLLLAAVGGGRAAGLLLLLQAGWYGLNHLTFGVPALLGKTALGIGLGAAALWGGVLPAVVGHAVYQVLVYRQFPKPVRPVAKAVS